MYAGVNVFVCDNMALSGDEIVMNRKHTSRFSPAAELTKAFDRYRDGALVLQRNIEDMKGGSLSLGDAQRKLLWSRKNGHEGKDVSLIPQRYGD